MADAYQNALRTIADVYEAEIGSHGGKSLSRVATIVVSSGAFFNRLRGGATFSVANLDKFASWFRVPANWPGRIIPEEAAVALNSIGRPPIPAEQHVGPPEAAVAFDPIAELKPGTGA
nr:hypothetical protein [uncultured Sphingomonas sp.]